MTAEYKAHAGELYALNAKALANHIRNAFGEDASDKEGREALLGRVFTLYIDRQIPLAGLAAPGATPSDTPHTAPPEDEDAPIDPLTAGHPMRREIEDLQKRGYRRVVDEDTGLAYMEGEKEVFVDGKKRMVYDKVCIPSEPGAFPEVEKYPVLAEFRKYQDRQEFIWFIGPKTERFPNGRRVMLGYEVMIHPQEGQLGYVDITVNDMWLVAYREEVIGLPEPHFRVLENSQPGSIEFIEEKQGQPYREIFKRYKGFNTTLFGRCLCDPKNGEVVHRLEEVVIQTRVAPPQELQHNW